MRTARDIVAALELVFRATLTGAVCPKIANAACYTASIALRGIEGSDLEEKLAFLEEKLRTSGVLK